jgi:hypothetical protein
MEADSKRFESLFQEHAPAVQAYCLRRAPVEALLLVCGRRVFQW